MGKSAARQGDTTAHGGVITGGEATVLIEGIPAARVTDMHVCPMTNPGSPPPPHIGGPILTGSGKVLISGLQAARIGDVCQCSGPPDSIISGCSSVLIGDSAPITDAAGKRQSTAIKEKAERNAEASDRETITANIGDKSDDEGPKEDHFLEMEFKDSGRRPITGVAYNLVWPDNRSERGFLTGKIKRTGVDPGDYKVLIKSITEARWSVNKAGRGDIVKILGSAAGFPDGTPVKIEIYESSPGRARRKFIQIDNVIIAGGKFESQWKCQWAYSDKDLLFPHRMGAGNYFPTYHFTAFIEECKAFSGPLYFTETLEIELTDYKGKGLGNREIVLHLSSGLIETKTLKSKGEIVIDGYPPALHGIEFQGLKGVQLTEWTYEKKTEIPNEIQTVEIYPVRPGINRFKTRRLRRFMDVGVWGKHHGAHSNTDFGLISGKHILLCTWKNMEQHIDATKPSINSIDSKMIYSPIIMEFFNKNKHADPDKDRAFIIDSIYDNMPLTAEDKGLLFLPDLHLHLFKMTKYDQFKYDPTYGIGRDYSYHLSLEKELEQLIKTAHDVGIRIIQVGDCFEIWESFVLLVEDLIKLDLEYRDRKTKGFADTIEDPGEYVNNWKELRRFLRDDKDSGDNRRLSFDEFEALRAAVMDPEIIRNKIIENYPSIFPGGEFPFTWIPGNHDNMKANFYYTREDSSNISAETLLDPGEIVFIDPNDYSGKEFIIAEGDRIYRGGDNNCIFAEHGHYYDPYNNDNEFSDDAKGFAKTKYNVLTGKHFSWLAELHPYYNPRDYQEKKALEKYEEGDDVRLVVMGHSHKAGLYDYDEVMNKRRQEEKDRHLLNAHLFKL